MSADKSWRLSPAESELRLIAAAPDLLAALEFAADKLDDAIRLGGCTAGSYKRARDEARAAIAKARGE